MAWYGWVLLTVAVAGAVAAVVLWFRARSLSTDVAEAKSLVRLAELRASRERIAARIGEASATVRQVDLDIIEAAADVARIRHRIDDMTAAEVAEVSRRLLRKTQGLIILFALLAYTGAAHAADPPTLQTQDLPPPDVQALTIDGHPGVWYPLDDARALVLELIEARRLLPLYRLRAEQADTALALAAESLAAAEAANEAGLGLAAAAEERATRAEYRRSAWWIHPLLWTAVGLVLGSVAAGFVVNLTEG